MYKVGASAFQKGYRVKHFHEVCSTNTEALDLARSPDTRGIWVVADVQTRGRGRRGREWQSLTGNLAASLIVPNIYDARAIPLLSYLFAVSLADTLESFAPHAAISVKWPNDILINGCKVSGILIETAAGAGDIPAVVCGIGVNCQAFPEETAFPATSLEHAGLPASPADLFEHLTDVIALRLEAWEDGKGFPSIRQQWLSRAFRLGSPMTIQQNHGVLNGIFETVDENGFLILHQPDGTRVPVTHGDVS